MTKDFFALSVLDPLIVGDESARLYQKLVRQDRLAMSVIGAFNFLGNNWDVKGPMLFTMRVDYLNDKNAQQVLDAIESVLAEVRTKGITEAELTQAKTALRSSFLEDMEGGFMPRFGRANLLAAFALFDNDPNADQHDSRRARQGDGRRREGGRGALVRADQSHVDRQPAGGEADGRRRSAMTRQAARRCAGRGGSSSFPITAVAQTHAVGAPRRRARAAVRAAAARRAHARRTACASIAVRYPTVPKVSVVLTIKSGLAVDPAEKAGPGAVRRRRRAGRNDDPRQRQDPAARSSRWARV